MGLIARMVVQLTQTPVLVPVIDYGQVTIAASVSFLKNLFHIDLRAPEAVCYSQE